MQLDFECCLLRYNMWAKFCVRHHCWHKLFFVDFFQLKTFSEKSTCFSMFANFFSQKKKKKKKKRKEKKIFPAFGLYEKITNFPIFLYRNNITTVIHHLKILINTKQLK